VRIADTAVANPAQLLAAVAGLKPLSQATVALQRGKQAVEVSLTVAQRPKVQARRAP
jgi:serine protease DegQ